MGNKENNPQGPSPESIKLGSDTLGQFLEAAEHNIIATYANLRSQYDPLAVIDGIYQKVVNNLGQSPEFVAAFFLIRSHSSFRGAVRLCLSGQVAESYMVLRGCLESALYGLYITSDTGLQETWIRRNDNEESLKQVKRDFTIRKVFDHLDSIDHETHGIARKFYERTIDYGGHPNICSVNSQIKTSMSDSKLDCDVQYLICGDLPHRVSLRSTTQIGICSLDIFKNVFSDIYLAHGIDKKINKVRQGF